MRRFVYATGGELRNVFGKGGSSNSATSTPEEIESPIPAVTPEPSVILQYQTPADLTKPRCDIIGNNNGIDNGLLVPVPWDGNEKTVDEIYNEHYADIATTTPPANSKGYLISDWHSNGLGAMDHLEYVEVAKDGLSYDVWLNDGYQNEGVQNYKFAKDTNGKGGDQSLAQFVPLQVDPIVPGPGTIFDQQIMTCD